jgi:hypothetical protein
MAPAFYFFLLKWPASGKSDKHFCVVQGATQGKLAKRRV